MNSTLVVQLVGGVALVGAGVALLLKGDTEVGVTLIVAGAAELGIKVAAPAVSGTPAPPAPPA